MKYDFDRVIDRRDTACEKYSFLKKHGLDEDVLPMWVADMDFETVPEIKERLRQITEHGIYGYTGRTDAYNEAVISWFSRRFQWKIVGSLVHRVWYLHWPQQSVLIQNLGMAY